MFEDIKRNTKIALQGNTIKFFSKQFSVFSAFMLFILSSIVCVWCLVIDTAPLASIGIFNNKLLHIAMCIFAVAENFVLFFVYLYMKLKNDAYFFNIVFPCKFLLNAKSVIKYFSVYITEKICKLSAFVIFFIPCGFVFYVGVKLLENGVSRAIFFILLFVFCILISFAIYTYSVYTCKYSMLSFVVLCDSNLSVKESFYASQKLTNGKCRCLCKLKICNITKYLLCILVIPAFYCIPYCKIAKNELLTEDKKPYALKKAHTGKSVVFYFSPIKEM